jgi:hypothetical protein
MSDEIFTALQDSTNALQSGDFAILHRRGRWHLIRVRDGRLRMLHFMTEDQARKMVKNWGPKGIVKTVNKVSAWFEADVQSRIKDSASEYLPLFEAGRVELLGFDASIWYPENITYDKKNFLEKVSKMMETGQSGFYLCFTDEHDK